MCRVERSEVESYPKSPSTPFKHNLHRWPSLNNIAEQGRKEKLTRARFLMAYGLANPTCRISPGQRRGFWFEVNVGLNTIAVRSGFKMALRLKLTGLFRFQDHTNY